MRLAKKAGFVLWGDGPRKGMVDWACEYDAELAKFEELIRADEREKFCALLRQIHDSYSLQSSAAIRAMSEK